jgi:radical SAM superfamily enzyme YgiQ (UPF0313 family)
MYTSGMRALVHQFDGLSTLDTLPLAAGLLVASARKDERLAAEAQLEIRTRRVEPDAAAERADVLAFSTYVWNERYSLEVARRGKEKCGAFVVFGGPSVPRKPERAAAFLREHDFVDAIVFGEGEVAFRDLLRALLEGRELSQIGGLALRDPSRPEGAVLTAPRERIQDFAATGSPYLDGTFDAFGATGAAILETNRGCPFACTFCDWGQAINSRVHELPLERVHAEIESIARRRIPYLYIVDANYGMRRRDLELVREIGRIKARTGFPQYVFFHLTKNATERHLEIVTALREAGIGTHLALSAQDFEERVLLAVKRENIRLDRALALRRVCHERGIPTFNELILGLPEQTYDSFAESMAKAVTPYPLDGFNLYLARLLENAEMASAEQRALHALETRRVLIASFHRGAGPTPVPEMEEVVVGTRTLPPGEWRRAFKLGFFLCAAHNLRLLDVVLQISRRCAGIDLRVFVEKLLARAALAPRESALGRIDAVLDQHAEAILAGQAMVLPVAETGSHLWAVEDAVLVTALAEREQFFAEMEQFVRDEFAADVVEEAVRYQALLAPAFGEAGPREAASRFDFPAWQKLPPDSSRPPAAREMSLRFRPAHHLTACRDLLGFVLAWLGAVHARLPLGACEELTPPA